MDGVRGLLVERFPTWAGDPQFYIQVADVGKSNNSMAPNNKTVLSFFQAELYLAITSKSLSKIKAKCFFFPLKGLH